jgi:hypothetical protein
MRNAKKEAVGLQPKRSVTEEKILTKHPLGKSGKNISKQDY